MLTDQELRITAGDQGEVQKGICIPAYLRRAAGKKDDRNVALIFQVLYALIQMVRYYKAAANQEIVYLRGSGQCYQLIQHRGIHFIGIDQYGKGFAPEPFFFRK
jgi:hypothetical protein